MSNPRIDILLKTITLLHRETLLGSNTDDSSKELAKTILTIFNTNSKNNQLSGGESTIIDDLMYLITDITNNPDGYDKESLVQSLDVILKDKPELIKVINKSIGVDMEPPSLKRTILTLRSRLNHYYKEYELRNLISKASYSINTGNTGEESLVDFAKSLATNIEALTFTTKAKDPGIVSELDINSEEAISTLFMKASSNSHESNLLKTGWSGINDMFQGGFRKGAFVVINALQHNYKSGMARTLLSQMLRHNKPVMKDPTKKPLMVYISFEDDPDIYISFFYQYLYNDEFGKVPNMDEITPTEAAAYVKRKLSINGYNVKMIRVNPSEWTYKHIFNKVLEYEAEGYELHAMMVDYLSKLPTTGCIQGATGTDMRDMFNRVRNYFSAKEILFITPHQLSTEAKQLIRNGVDGLSFVKEVGGKGYTEGSKQLDQVIDAELYLHKAKKNNKWVLTVGWGKDRRPGIVDDEKKYCILPFPKKAPIPDDLALDGTPKVLKSDADSSASDELDNIDDLDI